MMENISISNNSTPSFENRRVEQFFVGLFYILASVTMIVPYSMCMYIIHNEKKFKGVPFYRIALFMGVTDIGQLTFNGLFAGFACIIPYQMPYWVQKINGSILCGCWFTYTMLAHILAINRFITIFWPKSIDRIFSKRNTSILIALSFGHGLMWITMYMLPDVYERFIVADYGYEFDFTKSKSMLAVQLVMYEDYVHSTCMIVWYTLVYIKLKLKKREIVNQAIAKNDSKENKVLMQSVILCAMDIATIVGYLLIQLMPHSRWTSLLADYVWLFCAGNCSLIYLTLNSVVRARFLQMFCKGYDPNRKVVPTTVTATVPSNVKM